MHRSANHASGAPRRACGRANQEVERGVVWRLGFLERADACKPFAFLAFLALPAFATRYYFPGYRRGTVVEAWIHFRSPLMPWWRKFDPVREVDPGPADAAQQTRDCVAEAGHLRASFGG